MTTKLGALAALADREPGFHTGGLMLEHVAMEKPFSRVVGDERYRRHLGRANQKSVAPRRIVDFAAAPINDPEVVSVDMHGVRESRIVDHPDDDRFSPPRAEERFFGKPGNTIERPDLSGPVQRLALR